MSKVDKLWKVTYVSRYHPFEGKRVCKMNGLVKVMFDLILCFI